jgi:hypothetical protein
MLAVREGSIRFVTAAPLSKGELLRAKSGTGGLSNLSGDGERCGIIPTPWGVGERRIMACKSSMDTSKGADWSMGASRGAGDGELEGAKEPGLVGRSWRPRWGTTLVS